MPSLDSVLGSIPGLGGYLAKREMNEQAGMDEMKQFGALQGVLQSVQKQQRDAQLRQTLASSGGDLNKAMDALVAAGNLDGAKDLSAVIAARAKPQGQAIGAGGLRLPDGTIVPPVQRPQADNRPEIIRLQEFAQGLPEGDPRRAPIDARIKYLTERAPAQPSTAVQEYQLAKDGGFTGTFLEFKERLARAGRTPAQAPSAIQEYELAKSQGYKGTFLDFKRRQAEPESQDLARQHQIEQADSVLQTVTEARNLVSPRTAGVGGLGAYLPATPARNLKAKLESIKANLGFDRLQQMRRESPTGGALGQVAVQELVALQSTVASLDQMQEATELTNALNKIEAHYTKWKETVEKARAASQQQTAPGAQTPPGGKPKATDFFKNG